MSVKDYIYENRKEIDNIYIHDGFIKNIMIDVEKKKINMNIILTWPEDKICNIFFEKVINFEFNRLDFWGDAGGNICEIYLEEDQFAKEYVEEKVRNEEIKAKETNTSKPINIFKQDKFITVCIQLLSGDIERIICEKMTYIEE